MKTWTVNGIELAASDRGDGPVLLLVHGFPLDHTMWAAQIEDLAGEYRVIAPDLRGFGRSGVTPGAVTMEQLADDLAGLLDAMGIDGPVVFCGLSMGGYVAWQFWQRHGRRVRALILCDTRAVADAPQAADDRLAMADRVIREGPAPLVDAMTPKLFGRPTVEARPQLVDALRQVMLGTDPEGIAAASRGMAQRPDVTAALPEIDVAALVIVGELDAISTAREMRSIAQAIPQARFVEIAGCGHMSPMEKPAEVTAAIAGFLRELETTTGS